MNCAQLMCLNTLLGTVRGSFVLMYCCLTMSELMCLIVCVRSFLNGCILDICVEQFFFTTAVFNELLIDFI